MKENQLKLLESRINSAIAFIENLKSREKKLLSEKEELQKRVLSLQKGIEEKDKRNEDLLKTQKYLKEKIEFILEKLEGLAGLPGENPPDVEDGDSADAIGRGAAQPAKEQPAVKDRPRGSRPAGSGAAAGGGTARKEADGIIIEDRIVDLKEENEKNKPRTSTRNGQGGTRSNAIRSDSSKDGYARDLFSNDDESLRNDQQSVNATPGWYGDNPFVEI